MPLSTQNTSASTPSRLLDQVRAVIRMKHYSLRTEASYLYWILWIKASGGQWEWEKIAWQLPFKYAQILQLEGRILK